MGHRNPVLITSGELQWQLEGKFDTPHWEDELVARDFADSWCYRQLSKIKDYQIPAKL